MDVNQTPQEEAPKKQYSQIKIVGINLLVLAVYGILSKVAPHGEGWTYYAFLIAIHFLFCICAAIYNRNWMWVLSALLVLVIGFSTCVGSL
ncbi:hypothetical protein ACFQZS_08320 [Mucilaginibacter calamicampi]|uniref:Uncharacterized protein n=1 Tax=Mucilaginibacter calamicampi TaxID=1302352 RepID=A0ABW2YUR2_9SPHI